MKIVNREAFLRLPSGTLFSKFEFCAFEELCIKGENVGDNDFYVQSINDAVACGSSSEFAEILIGAAENGKMFEMDFELEGRDGLFEDDALYAVWDDGDVGQLVERLQRLIKGSSVANNSPPTPQLIIDQQRHKFPSVRVWGKPLIEMTKDELMAAICAKMEYEEFAGQRHEKDLGFITELHGARAR